MEKYHELTERIIGLESSDADSEIRKWLEERAAKLCEYCEGPLPREIYKELRLNHDGKPMTWKTAITDEKPEQKKSCIEEHSNWVKTEYSYCPSCGCELLNPHLTQAPLVERLADVINGAMNDDPKALWSEKRIAAAQAAINFLREHKGEL